MDKNRIMEITLETIKESTEWGLECEDKTYGNWIDGVITVVSKLIDEIDKNACGTNTN